MSNFENETALSASWRASSQHPARRGVQATFVDLVDVGLVQHAKPRLKRRYYNCSHEGEEPGLLESCMTSHPSCLLLLHCRVL